MKFLPVVDNTQMEEMVSQIFDIGPSFYFMIKNGKLLVIFFLNIYSSFHKMRTKTYIKILRHGSTHIYPKNKL